MASIIRISILADAANAVRGFRTTDAAANRTSRELAQLQRQVARLKAQNVSIGVKTRGFRQAVTEIVTARLVLDRLGKGLPDLSFGLDGVAKKFSLVAAAALAATAAATPLVGVTVAIGAAFGAAAAGAGLFAAVALPTLKSVTTAVGEYNTASHAFDRAQAVGDTKAMATAQKAMKSSLGALTPVQRAAAQQVIAMNRAWEKLSASQAPVVLGIISRAAGTLASIMPRLNPAISAMAKAFSSVSDKAFAGLSKSVTPFANFVKNQGAPAFKSLATIVGNLLVVVGHIATAFAPLGNTILSKLAPLTAAMRSINFDSLAKSAAKLLPVVGRLLGNLGGALLNLIKAAAPLAGPVLNALADIAGVLKKAFAGPEIKTFVANIAKMVPAVAPIVAVIVPMFLKFAAIISGQLLVLVPKLLPIIKQMADVFINVVTGLSPLLPALLDLVGVLVSFLPVLYPLITAFRQAMIPVIKAVGAALIQLRPVFALIVGAVIKLLGPISGLIVAFVKIVPILITALMPAFLAIADAVGKVLPQIAELFPVFARLATPIADLIVALAPIIPILVSALVPAITVVADVIGKLLVAFKPVAPVLVKVIQALADGLQPVFKALGDALPQIVSSLDPLIQSLLTLVIAVLPVIPPISLLVVALIKGMLPAVLQLAPALVPVVNAIAKALPDAIAVLLPLINAVTKILGNRTVMAGFTIGVTALAFALKSGAAQFTFMWNTAKTVLTFMLDLPRSFQAVASGIIDGFVNGIRNGFDKVKKIFQDLTNKLPSWKGPPERDAKLLHNNGQLILGSLISGIQSRVPALKSQLADVSSMIQGGVSAKADLGLLGSGGSARVTVAPGSSAPAAPVNVYISVAPGADLAEVGRVSVAAIEAHERRTGRRRLLTSV